MKNKNEYPPIIRTLTILFADRNATIETGKLCEVDIVEFQFNQFMYNLISNAIKFARPGVPPVIKINATIAPDSKLKPKSLVPDKKYCHITFSDNGIGFEKKFSETIFEVFRKLHSKDEFSGTGIGLATVKKNRRQSRWPDHRYQQAG